MTLGALGLDGPAEDAYRCLVAQPSATAAQLAADLGCGTAEIRHALELLAARGLAARSGADLDRYVAAPPAVALGAVLSQRHDDLRRAEVAIAALAEEHRRAVAGRPFGDLIEVINGAEGIRQRVDQIQRAARTEVRAFVTARATVVRTEENTVEQALVQRGIRYRVIVERAALESPVEAQAAVEATAAGEEVRVTETLPVKLIVADRDLALVSLPPDPHGEPAAVLLHSSGLLEALAALFEAYWEHARPLQPAADSSLDPDDARILALMLAGLTDRSIAGHLGMSMRTVQRRVHCLMELAGVQTRIQLGWHAARAGWA
ncbi:helix-turn-helix domain-containing protein [Longispora albida]|uniref:helix-turn-helix domain-containing protein n=1 Tax=Longispora albida TaxID=203523 RepID=UPI00035E953F|nr:helix-turn-helix domain-containing protein [Longispora albida]